MPPTVIPPRASGRLSRYIRVMRKEQQQNEMTSKKLRALKTWAGLWIDHREAVIVFLSGNRQETRRITSGVEKQLRRSGRSPSAAPFEAQMVPADDSREREYTGNLAHYYD